MTATYLILVERTVIEHYHVEADSAMDANEEFVRMGLEEGWPEPAYVEDGLDVEVREEETQMLVP